jgi:hypothetical protein
MAFDHQPESAYATAESFDNLLQQPPTFGSHDRQVLKYA